MPLDPSLPEQNIEHANGQAAVMMAQHDRLYQHHTGDPCEGAWVIFLTQNLYHALIFMQDKPPVDKK